MTARRAWCLLVHRWWVPTRWAPMVVYPDTYLCVRCGEAWSRP